MDNNGQENNTFGNIILSTYGSEICICKCSQHLFHATLIYIYIANIVYILTKYTVYIE